MEQSFSWMLKFQNIKDKELKAYREWKSINKSDRYDTSVGLTSCHNSEC